MSSNNWETAELLKVELCLSVNDMAKKEENSQLTAFVSYSHRDERFRSALETHLSILRRKGLLRVWHDRKITPGLDIDQEIDSNLRKADLIVLLVSPDFIASDYCYSTELRLAMELHASGRARVVPVILRPVDWQDAPFSKLLALPKDGKPISTWSNRDRAFLDVENGIRKILDELSASPKVNKSAPAPASFVVHRYMGSVLQTGGVGSDLVTKRAWLTSEHGYLPADDYVTHSFNGAGDVLWVHCPDEFEIVGATSWTKNEVFQMMKGDPRFPWGILLKDQLKNSVTITCQRKSTATELPHATGACCPNCADPMGPYEESCARCGYTFKIKKSSGR